MTNTAFLVKNPLFSNLSKEDIEAILPSLNPRVQSYAKETYIYSDGDQIQKIGLILEGELHIVKEDYWGNQTILSKLIVNDFFGETYACLPPFPIHINVISASASKVLFLEVTDLLTPSPFHTESQSHLIENLLRIFAQKNLMLVNKMEHITKRTTREKLLSYLSQESSKNKSSSFEIPFNRQQLADFLSVDRSAMSKELCKLRDEKVLVFKKNKFKML